VQRDIIKNTLALLGILMTFTIVGQNVDSFQIIYQDDKLIEIVKPFYPEMAKRVKGETYIFSLPKDTTSLEEKYGVLKDGEVKVYNRFFQISQYIQYRDSSIVLYEWYDNGIKKSQQKFLQGDSIYVLMFYNPDGTPQDYEYISPDSIQQTKWFENGKIHFQCTLTDLKKEIQQRDCYYWNEQGQFSFGERELLKVFQEFMGPQSIQNYQLDNKGKIIE